MYPLLIVALFAWLNSSLITVADLSMDKADFYAHQNRLDDQARLVQAVKEAYQNNIVYPDLATLQAAAGNEHLASNFSPHVKYAVSSTLTDANCQFLRILVYSQNPKTGLSESDYLSGENNKFSSDDFVTALDWTVKDSKSVWFSFDTRQNHLKRIAGTHKHLRAILKKFATYYNTNGHFPNEDQTGSPLATDSFVNLADLANFPGSATTCTGIFSYDGIPMSCYDLFGPVGDNIVYHYKNDNYILVEARTGIQDENGTEIIILELLNVE